MRFFFCAAYALGLAFVLSGCGPGRGDVGGKITHENKALAVGSIVIEGGDGMAKSAMINPDGTYLVKDVGAGAVKAVVSSPDPADKKIAVRKRGTELPPEKKGKTDPNWFPIPDEYADFNKSGLTFQLKSGANTWNIDLKEK